MHVYMYLYVDICACAHACGPARMQRGRSMCSNACMHAGAPNFIMAECSSYMKADGSIAPLDDAAKQAFMDKVDELSEQALRVLAIACVHVGKDLPFDSEDETDVKFGKLLKATCARTGKVLPGPYTLHPKP